VSKTLIITEKPSVARDVAGALPGAFTRRQGYMEGATYVITWAVGHLLELADPDRYDDRYKRWRLEDLPILPEPFKLVTRRGGGDQLKAIKGQLKRPEITRVINACDAGREGELIFAWIMQHARNRKPVARLWLSSMTEQAIRCAIGSLRPAAHLQGLEDAARCRAEADWVVGMNASRAAAVTLRGALEGSISVGRVQTPTLAILVGRELEIRNFKSETYWTVDAVFAADSARRYPGRYKNGLRLMTAAAARAIADACRGQAGVITRLDKKLERERAPLLPDLTTLQREANRRFGFSAKRTLAAAQGLYETHRAITYPRTDSRYLTTDMIGTLKPTAAAVGRHAEYAAAAGYVASMTSLPAKRMINDAKVTDHHAIIPTDAAHPTGAMNADERQVFDLVCRAFLAVFHPDAVFERTTVETVVDAAYPFHTTGRIVVEPGWRAVYGETAPAAGDDDDAKTLPPLTHGETVRAERCDATERQTKPPPRYTDASLLAAMETAGRLVDDDELREAMKGSGLGTPATRASIIERLLGAGYAERQKRAVAATDKGIGLIGALNGHQLTSPELTGAWEKRLAEMERGQGSRSSFMADIAAFTGMTVNEISALNVTAAAASGKTVGACPNCQQPVVEQPRSFSCAAGCGLVIWKQIAGLTLPSAAISELLTTGRTAQPAGPFTSRAGKKFDARLALRRRDGQITVVFDEPWAQGPNTPAAPRPASKRAAAKRPARKRPAKRAPHKRSS
jgi:DNA topoisomerase-3